MLPLAPFTCRLPTRRILRVRGTDAHEFLQGIFTTDLRELHPSGSMYGCFLYFTGRVMCDAHLYQCRRLHDGQASILVDVHQDVEEELYEHLREMKMRKKVVIEKAGDDLAVVATLESVGHDNMEGDGSTSDSDATCGAAGVASPPLATTLAERRRECFPDARNAILFPPPQPLAKSPATEKMSDESERPAADASGAESAEPSSSPGASDSVAASTRPPWFLKRCVVPVAWAPPLAAVDPYTRLLYSRGLAEGPTVFKHNKTLPFEGNLDFIKGVSFHKGCYVGQELTHRTHVMLVTRKRTVPLVFGSAGAEQQPVLSRPVGVGEALYTAAKEKIGEVTGVCGDVGVGLLRLRYVAKESRTVPGLQLQDGTPVSMHLPEWWPKKEVRKLLKNNS